MKRVPLEFVLGFAVGLMVGSIVFIVDRVSAVETPTSYLSIYVPDMTKCVAISEEHDVEMLRDIIDDGESCFLYLPMKSAPGETKEHEE